MEELQIIFVITLRLQVTQTFIIVIRIKLLQPEKKISTKRATQINRCIIYAHCSLSAALVILTSMGGIYKAVPENQSSPPSCILCFEHEPSVAWLFPQYLPPLVSFLVLS